MYSLLDKIKYYKNRYNLSDRNKSGFARGFVNGSSQYHSKWHNQQTKKELSYLYYELKNAKTVSDRDNIMESISYCKGCLRGYDEKNKSWYDYD